MNEGVPSIMNRYQVPQKQQYMMMGFMGKMGFTPGVSDIIIGHNGKMYCVELKTDIGKQSKGQKIFQSNAERTNIEYVLIRSFEEMKEAMRAWKIIP